MRWLAISALLFSASCADDPVSAAADAATSPELPSSDGQDVLGPEPDAPLEDAPPIQDAPPIEDAPATEDAPPLGDVPVLDVPLDGHSGPDVPTDDIGPTADADPEPDAGPLPDQPPAEFSTCKAHKDCVPVEMGCCDHCNGGSLFVANEAFVDQLDPWKETGCEVVGCTKIGCMPVEGVCNSGVCAWQQKDLTPSCDGMGQETCDKTAGCAGIMGAPVAEICAENFDNWGTIWSGCMSEDVGCGEAETCAQSSVSGEKLIFPTTCVPDGWTVLSECCVSP